MANSYKTSSPRSAPVVSQDGAKERIESAFGTRWAISANRKRSLPDHRFDVVKVWTLKARVDGKIVTVATSVDEDRARRHIESTFDDLSSAAGMLTRAATYLIGQYDLNANTLTPACAAIGILQGLAYVVRPVRNTLS
jgi:hypothetical protein